MTLSSFEIAKQMTDTTHFLSYRVMIEKYGVTRASEIQTWIVYLGIMNRMDNEIRTNMMQDDLKPKTSLDNTSSSIELWTDQDLAEAHGKGGLYLIGGIVGSLAAIIAANVYKDHSVAISVGGLVPLAMGLMGLVDVVRTEVEANRREDLADR